MILIRKPIIIINPFKALNRSFFQNQSITIHNKNINLKSFISNNNNNSKICYFSTVSTIKNSINNNGTITTTTTTIKGFTTRKPKPLPQLEKEKAKRVFYGVVGVSMWIVATVCFFNYERVNNNIIQTSLLHIKKNPLAIETLGNNIGFSSSWPWVIGKVNILKGKVDVKYSVKGNKAKGKIHFRAIRIPLERNWKVLEFSLTKDNGEVVLLKLPNEQFFHT
ncbi:7659_t:CDS:2 [Entrophospora sp. SA101]|nr:8177_t:CDS:2 [Entrophospora sp. SA101]CAJ0630087.1 7452_t:CDS:2 [Entrophospora sp. SA101]CAJ0758060.1 7659_t:CDS:2 [Entrophospora sp. SA101]CAJ0826419.1 10591_t:CDS:2 [Entrophospora sp. SA101]CAJ0827078.1 15935_t:CDS:2 [Entrophospora sp. SA101]